MTFTLALVQLAASSLLSLVLTLAVVGFIVWLVTTYIPMPAVFRTVIIAVAAIVLILYLARWLGVAI